MALEAFTVPQGEGGFVLADRQQVAATIATSAMNGDKGYKISIEFQFDSNCKGYTCRKIDVCVEVHIYEIKATPVDSQRWPNALPKTLFKAN